jgi:copper resistance protein D
MAQTTGAASADRLRPVGWAVLVVATAFVASALAGALASTTVPVLLGTSATRSMMDVAGVACVGVALAGVLVKAGAGGWTHRGAKAVAALRVRIDRVLIGVAGLWLLTAVLGTFFRTADAFGRSPGSIGTSDLVAWVTRLGAGRGMVLTFLCAAVVLGCAVARLRDRKLVQIRIPLVAALLGVLTPAVTGHSGADADHEIAVITIAFHVGAAALWVGGLGALLVLVARERELLDAALPSFSTLAGVCVFAVGITGVINAAIRLTSFDALVTTGYGWLLIGKAVALLAVGALGGLTRGRLRAGRVPVLRWAAYETALMAVTLGLAAALSQSSPVV